MDTLYDLLGALPRDDAEGLRTAFRRAVKSAHPDLKPGDPRLLTIGTVEALKSIGRTVTVLAPPDLTSFLRDNGIDIVTGYVDDGPLFVRGGEEELARFVQRVDDARSTGNLGLGVLGNPLSDFPGLPPLLRPGKALKRRLASDFQ